MTDQAAREEVRRKANYVVIWLMIMSCLSPMLLAGAGVWYTNHNQHKSDQRWCDLMKTIDRPSLPPPVSEDQRQARVKFHKLRKDMGC